MAKLQSAYDELQTKKDDLAQAQAELQASRDDLDSKQSEIKTATASLNGEKGKVQAQIDAFQEQINSLNDKIAAEQAAAEAERRAAQEAAQNTDDGSGDGIQVISSGVPMVIRTITLFESEDSSGQISLQRLFDGEEEVADVAPLDVEDIARVLCRGE